MEQAVMQLGQYGGIASPMLLLAYIIWQIVKENKKSDEPTHASLEGGMAQCEHRLKDEMKAVKQAVMECKPSLEAIHKDTSRLYDMHNIRDDDGMPIWYNKRSLENRIIGLADTLEGQTHSIDRLCNLLEDYAKKRN